MRDVSADIAEPRVNKTLGALSGVVPAQEAEDAIRKAFPCEGNLRVHHLWSTNGLSRFRVNWFHEENGKTMIVKSLFLGLTRTVDGLVVRDETIAR